MIERRQRPRRDIHDEYDFFEYVRLDDDSVPAADRKKIDVALLDMNHSWPNVGHDSLVSALLESAAALRDELASAGLKVRVISFDVRRRLQLPDAPNGRFQLYVGTGGPGHLDPRKNDGISAESQGIVENIKWEAPLFNLFDAVVKSERAALLAVCHSFGLLCRWSGVAAPRLRDEKSTGMPLNVLTEQAATHPWFSKFAEQLPDHRHFRVIDNRLFDLQLQSPGKSFPVAFESENTDALTMMELARDGDMPRVLGTNHHPEIVDRAHVLQVLDLKRKHAEVDDQWFQERAHTMRDLFQDENERQSQLTSEYSLLGPLRHHLARLIAERR